MALTRKSKQERDAQAESAEVRIRIMNGPRETNRTARVLLHARGSSDISLKLLVVEIVQNLGQLVEQVGSAVDAPVGRYIASIRRSAPRPRSASATETLVSKNTFIAGHSEPLEAFGQSLIV